jgi:hypothetical protein
MSVLIRLTVLLSLTGCSAIVIVADCDVNHVMQAVQQDIGLVFQVKQSHEITADSGRVVHFRCNDVDWTNEMWFGSDCVFNQVKRLIESELVRMFGSTAFQLSSRKSVVNVRIEKSKVFLY